MVLTFTDCEFMIGYYFIFVSEQKMAKQKKSWEKRLKGKTDDLAVDFVESLSYDVRLYKYDIVGSIAHAKILSEQGLINKTEFRIISFYF